VVRGTAGPDDLALLAEPGSRRPPVVLWPPDRSPGAARASPAMTRTRACLVLLGVSVLGVVSGVRAESASRSAEGPSSTSGRPGPHRGQW